MSDKNFDAAKINSAFGTAKDAEALLKKMQDSCPKYIPTGFSKLDNVLNGGLTASLYVLGAMPSLGKSTFLINMSEKIAYSGTAVLYFSLEMPADHIARGTLCRCLFNAGNGLPKAKHLVTAAELLKENEIKKIKGQVSSDILTAAFEQYKTIGENFYVIDRNYISEYNQKKSTIAASFVRKYVEDFIKKEEQLAKENEKKEKRNVVVIMDYLQLLSPEENMKTI